MAIPKEILAVKRPKSTVVKASYAGKYVVVLRKCIYVKGNESKPSKNLPIELGTIGYIVDGKYIEKEKPILKDFETEKARILGENKSTIKKAIIETENVDIKQYGKIFLFDSLNKDLLIDLSNIFDDKTAYKLYLISLLVSSYKGITQRDMAYFYKTSFLSEIYPNIGLSESLVCELLQNVGMNYSKIIDFMKKRVEKYSKDSIVIDGTLLSYNSESYFSPFSRKGRQKGSKDISLLYSFDLNTKEPVACKPYQGNMLDSTAFLDFGRTLTSKNQLFILDKGFSTKEISNLMASNDFSYLIPLKNNSSLIKNNNLLDFDGVFKYDNENIQHKKAYINNKYYYSFKNTVDENSQRNAYLNKAHGQDNYDINEYRKKDNTFGVIAFESSISKEPKDIYESYLERWNIELLFKNYKHLLGVKSGKSHNNYNLYASQFVDYLSLIMTSRVVKKLESLELNKKYSFNQIMNYLSSIEKIKINNEWKDNIKLKYVDDLFNTLKSSI